MKTVVVLGAGLVARPLVRHLASRAGTRVVIADVSEERARALAGGLETAEARRGDASDPASLRALLMGADLAVSLLPAPFHPRVAAVAVETRTDLVTTSYVSPEMEALDRAARKRGILLMNEVGLDPGIDHMSALRAIRAIRARGGRVVGFRSVCGGLPAPENRQTNPWSYKFSWSPRGVLVAARSGARWLEAGRVTEVDGERLFSATVPFPVDGLGPFEIYPNRDSIAYLRKYELDGVEDMMRGTVRWHRWGETLGAAVRLGLLDTGEREWPEGTTWAGFVASLLAPGDGSVRERVASRLGLPADHDVLDRFAWAGFFSDEPIPSGPIAPLDVTCARLTEKLAYAPRERDMVLLEHSFRIEEADGSASTETHRLVAFGDPDGDSAMSRTVGLPAAVVAGLRIDGRLALEGVRIPVAAEVVDPVLDELDGLGIVFEERKERPDLRRVL